MRLVKIAKSNSNWRIKGCKSSAMTVVGFTHVENHEDAYELGEAKGDTKFERGKSRDHSSPALPGKLRNIKIKSQVRWN